MLITEQAKVLNVTVSGDVHAALHVAHIALQDEIGLTSGMSR